MAVHCKKCGRDADAEAITPTLACPFCGAIYAKVDAAIDAAAKADESKRASEATRAAEEQKRAEATKKAEREQTARNALSQSICGVCGSLMKPRKVTNGSGAVEFGLWAGGVVLTLSVVLTHIGIILLLVALLYSLWRFFSRRNKVCSKCGSPQIFPADTPRGREELLKRGLLDPN